MRTHWLNPLKPVQFYSSPDGARFALAKSGKFEFQRRRPLIRTWKWLFYRIVVFVALILLFFCYYNIYRICLMFPRRFSTLLIFSRQFFNYYRQMIWNNLVSAIRRWYDMIYFITYPVIWIRVRGKHAHVRTELLTTCVAYNFLYFRILTNLDTFFYINTIE